MNDVTTYPLARAREQLEVERLNRAGDLERAAKELSTLVTHLRETDYVPTEFDLSQTDAALCAIREFRARAEMLAELERGIRREGERSR